MLELAWEGELFAAWLAPPEAATEKKHNLSEILDDAAEQGPKRRTGFGLGAPPESATDKKPNLSDTLGDAA